MSVCSKRLSSTQLLQLLIWSFAANLCLVEALQINSISTRFPVESRSNIKLWRKRWASASLLFFRSVDQRLYALPADSTDSASRSSKNPLKVEEESPKISSSSTIPSPAGLSSYLVDVDPYGGDDDATDYANCNNAVWSKNNSRLKAQVPSILPGGFRIRVPQNSDDDQPTKLSTLFSRQPSMEDLQQQKVTMNEAIDASLKWTPMAMPVLAYAMYDPTAESFAYLLDVVGQTNWVAVDGGAYQAKIIAPAVNGVVVPAISILFANLIGTTITTLRQRQLDIQNCINMEASQLRILQSILDVFPKPSDSTTARAPTSTIHNYAQESCRRYLTQYTSRLISESQPNLEVNSLDYSLDTELNGILAELNRLSSAPANEPNKDAPSDLILSNAYAACTKLYEERAKRITALRSLFPPLHFVIVTTLAVSICIAFLLETKQDILVFLNAIQLRILWTMLVGTFTALAIVCYDLGNPFRGSYEISKSVHQLYTIRMALRASLQQKALSSSSPATNTITAEKE